MQMKYLGTAAAEGIPGMFCECEICKKSKEAGGRNIRTRSQALIDDFLLIDFPADTYMHMLCQGLDLPKIRHCIITHNHSDHLYPADFEMRRVGFAYPDCDEIMTVYGTKPSGAAVAQVTGQYGLVNENRVVFQTITPFVPFFAGRYCITALKANHDPSCEPVFYMISDGEKTLLYANDTGYFPDETWAFFEREKPQLDLVSLDCTEALGTMRDHHMCLTVNAEVKERLLSMGCANENTHFCINHFSHNGKATYDDLVKIAEKYNFTVSYDGLEIKI